MADISKIEDLTGAIYDIKDASAREQIKEIVEGYINTVAPLKGTKAATSADNTAVAVGDGANAASNTIVIGQNAKASIQTGIIIGNNASSGASDSIGIGHNVYAGRSSSIVIGNKASVGESSEVVIGVGAAATGLNSTAIGSNASAKAANSVAVGGSSYTTEQRTFAVASPSQTRRVINVTDPVNNQDAATKKYVDTTVTDAVGNIVGMKFSVVTELPTSGENGTIYLIAHEHGDGDSYDEYIWLDTSSKFEKIGNTDVDLTDYIKRTDISTTTENGVMSAADKTKLDGIEEGATNTIVDQSYSATSANAQSGTAVAEALTNFDISKKINSISPLIVDKAANSLFHESTIAIGNGALAGQSNCVTIGANASSNFNSHNVVIGSEAASNDSGSVAVGYAATIGDEANDSVAIGSGSKATEKNTVSFGRAEYSNHPTTRRLVQVTDPVNAQDAATKNYVDTAVSTKADQTDLDLTNKNIATLATGLSQKANQADVKTIQTKLDTIEEGANKTITDQTYSGASTNPQSGTAVKEALKTIVSGLAFSLTEAGLVHVELMEA